MRHAVTRWIRAAPAVVAGLLLLHTTMAPPPLAAQQSNGETAEPEYAVSPVERRAQEIRGLFREDPGEFESVFAASFLQQVPATALEQIFIDYHSEHGRATGLEVIGPFVSGVTVIRLTFEDGTAALMQLAVEPAEPHRVIGAVIGPSFSITEEQESAGKPTAEGHGSASGKQAAARKVTIDEPSYAMDEYVTRTLLRLPFDGEWWVFWGGRTQATNYHRASALQRYAYDLVVRKEGSTHADDGKENADYWCQGRPILAPAPGTIVTAKDGVAENVPGEMNSYQKLGNHVVIDHGNGEFSLLAHLQTGSVAVEPGDEVATGERIGACGNSGNSTEPHLHYQLQTAPDFFESQALPAPFHDYVADGEPVDVGEPVRGQTIEPLPEGAAEPPELDDSR